jgi:hypothetical protein
MSERVERNSLVFKLGVFVVVAMFATIPMFYLLPLFGPILPDNPAGTRIGLAVAMFALQFALFVLFLRAARLLLCTTRELALLCAVNLLIVVAFCLIKSAGGDDQPIVTFMLIPMTIAATYCTYCGMRKLV